MTGLTNFLELSYEELEERNLQIKAERAKNRSSEYYEDIVLEILREEKRIKAVTVVFTDIEGKFLMLDYNKNFFLEAFDNLTFDGSSIRGFTAQAQSDLRLKVNWRSFKWLPSDVFGPGKVLVFCNVCDRDGSLYKSDFRGQLQYLSNELYKKDQIIVHASPEIEGILLEGTNAEHCFTEPVGFNLATYGGYFNALPNDKLRLFIDKVAEATRAMGFENEKDHAEVAPSQFELSYKYTDILQAADYILLYKLVCRQIAKANGYTATFLPKPVTNINGSGMHTNISLSRNAKNIFYDAQDENKLSQDAYKFLTSILYYAKDICLILNSSVNSYRRLDPSFEAPNEIKVSANDRSAMIRIPLGNEKTARIEVRSVSPDCNPYLEMYSLLMAGLKGVRASEKEYQEFATILQKREKLPVNIYDAIRYFKRSDFIKEILGEENQQKYCALKEEVANRSPKELGRKVKSGEVRYHHEITNQSIWSEF